MSDRKLKDILLLALLLGFVVFMTQRCTYDKLPEPAFCDTLIVTYSANIKKIMETSCTFGGAPTGCHVSGGIAPGDFTIYSVLKAIADDTKLKNRVVNLKDMPPPYSLGPKTLADSNIQKINCWIDAGAPNN